MKQKIIILSILIITILNIGIITSISAYNYIKTPHYGDTEYNGIPITYLQKNDTNNSNYGWISNKGVFICLTGNETEDKATFYHEMYHLTHSIHIDDDTGAEKYASEMVPEYIPKKDT